MTKKKTVEKFGILIKHVIFCDIKLNMAAGRIGYACM